MGWSDGIKVGDDDWWHFEEVTFIPFRRQVTITGQKNKLQNANNYSQKYESIYTHKKGMISRSLHSIQITPINIKSLKVKNLIV